MKPTSFTGIVIKIRRKQQNGQAYPQLVKHHIIPRLVHMRDLPLELQPVELLKTYPITEYEVTYEKVRTTVFR